MEIWKKILGYEDYEISNLGRVKSLERKKWIAQIYINGKVKYLGSFNNEIDAHNAYQNKLLSLNI